MSRVISFATFILVLAVIAYPAQAFETGTWRLAGGTNGSFSSISLEGPGGDADMDSTEIALSAGYFINPNAEIGVTYISSSQEFDGVEILGQDDIIPFFNYYLNMNGNYMRFGIGYIIGTVTIETEDIDVDGFQVRGGYINMIGESFSIDIEAIYEDTEWSLMGETVDATGFTFGAGFSIYI